MQDGATGVAHRCSSAAFVRTPVIENVLSVCVRCLGKNKAMAFCEAKIDGGKWDLMFHVAPAVAPALRYKHAFWTEKGKTMGKYAAALEADFKSALFNTRKGNKELLIVAKGNKGKTTWGWASYVPRALYNLRRMRGVCCGDPR